MSALDPLERWPRSNLTTPTKPDAWMSPQDRTDSDFKPSGPAFSTVVRDCNTIGDYDEPRQRQPPGSLNVLIPFASMYWARLETAARSRTLILPDPRRSKRTDGLNPPTRSRPQFRHLPR